MGYGLLKVDLENLSYVMIFALNLSVGDRGMFYSLIFAVEGMVP